MTSKKAILAWEDGHTVEVSFTCGTRGIRYAGKRPISATLLFKLPSKIISSVEDTQILRWVHEDLQTCLGPNGKIIYQEDKEVKRYSI